MLWPSAVSSSHHHEHRFSKETPYPVSLSLFDLTWATCPFLNQSILVDREYRISTDRAWVMKHHRSRKWGSTAVEPPRRGADHRPRPNPGLLPAMLKVNTGYQQTALCIYFYPFRLSFLKIQPVALA